MDCFLFNVAKKEIEGFIGSYLLKVKQLSPWTIELVFGGERKGGIIVSINPEKPRIYPTTNVYQAVKEPSPFVMLLRKHILRDKLQGVHLPPFERVITLSFSSGHSLIFEVLGRFSALYLVKDGVILGTFGRKRKDLEGVYLPPEREGMGLPRRAVEEMNGLSQEERKAYMEWLKECYQKGIYPWGEVDFEKLFGEVEEKERDFREKEVERERKERLKKVERLLKRLEEERKKLERMLEYKKLGDLLSCNLWRVKKGDRSVVVEDFETGSPITIELDPAKTPSENLEEFYRRYKKAKKGLDILEKRMEELRKKLREEEKAPVKVKVHGVFQVEKGKPYKKLKSPGGFTVYMGLSAKGNDLIRREFGSPEDLWFHIKGLKGPHVIMKRDGSREFGEEDMAFAASLALGGRKGRFEVDYTELKNVKKPKGSPPGFVIYKNHRTMVVDGD